MKSAVITGASQGIGKAVALHLAGIGYHLLLISRNAEKLNELREAIVAIDSSLYVEVAACDVVNKQAIDGAVALFIEKVKTLSLVFNNAGYVKRGTGEIDEAELKKMVDVNLIGAVNTVQAVLPFMRAQQHGYIMNMCSRNAKVPRSFLGGYAATKAALLAFNESLYKELAQDNIKVTALCPGFVDTDMTSGVKADRSDLIPTEDLCRVVEFLLSLSPSSVFKEISFESKIQIGGYC